MEKESMLSLLGAQIQCAKSQAMRVREVGKDASAIEGIVGSLRLTYAALHRGLLPKNIDPQAFLLWVDGTGEHEVTLGDRTLPVSGAYARHLFKEAGVKLRSGQVLLLESGFARDLVEEALARVAHDQAAAERERSALEAIFGRPRNLEAQPPEKVFEDAVKRAFEDALGKKEDVHRRKVALLSAGLALDELEERKDRSQRAA